MTTKTFSPPGAVPPSPTAAPSPAEPPAQVDTGTGHASRRPGAGRRANLLVLAPQHRLDGPVEPMLRCEALIIDLQAPIDSLRSLKCDLEAYYWDNPALDDTQRNRRFQITFWVRQVTDRTAALESLLLHKGSSRLVLDGLTADERDTVERAAVHLRQWIHEDDSFRSVLRTVATILGAADRISLAAAAASPEPPRARR